MLLLIARGAIVKIQTQYKIQIILEIQHENNLTIFPDFSLMEATRVQVLKMILVLLATAFCKKKYHKKHKNNLSLFPLNKSLHYLHRRNHF